MKKSFLVLLIILVIAALTATLVWNATRGDQKVVPVDNSSAATQQTSPQSTQQPRKSIETSTAKTLGVIFQSTEWWGYPEVYVFDPSEYVSGTRYLIAFHEDPLGFEPAVYIESNDFRLHAPGDAWGFSANQVDLHKTDDELIKDLSFPWTTSMRVERISLSGSDGLLAEEYGVDPLDQTSYHCLYYFFPKYDEKKSWNLTVTVVNPTDLWQIENFLRTIIFLRPNEGADGLTGPIRYNCELSGGSFTNGHCICPTEGMQTQTDMYDTSTGFCQSSAGGPIGDAFNASIGLPYGDYSHWMQIVMKLCTDSGGDISGVACICPEDKNYSKTNGRCE